ncbi:MAG: SIMPL domain-containing protein [Nocardioidaceae bacterium]|nr:SIMPL domain-containing protein [Nocardioidaceae bacterium]
MSRYLEVVGRGAATQTPDRLDLYVGVSAVRDDVGTALAHLGTQVGALGEALRALGLGDADLRTTSSSVGEEYRDGTPSGYRASQDLTVRLKDPEQVSAVIDGCVAAVGDDFRLGHLAWSIADEAPLAAAAREAAFADARAKAEALSALAGGEVGKLLRVTENEGFGGGVVRMAAAKADAGFAVERGENRVEVSLTTRWALH